ncbi:MAG: hypothetical protein WKF37_17980 [Bryobacteraceae bacterium]
MRGVLRLARGFVAINSPYKGMGKSELWLDQEPGHVIDRIRREWDALGRIPTIPDIVSTWGIYQIVENVERFAKDIDRSIPPLGIVATKVQVSNLHRRIIDDLKARRLGRFAEAGAIQQPPLFEHSIPQSVSVARGADVEADIRTFKGKYAAAYESFRGRPRNQESMRKEEALITMLNGLVKLLSEEAGRNPDFANRLESLLSPLQAPKPTPSTKPNQLDLPDVYSEFSSRGESEFRLWLRDQPVAVLYALIRRHDLDATGRSAKWKDQRSSAPIFWINSVPGFRAGPRSCPG